MLHWIRLVPFTHEIDFVLTDDTAPVLTFAHPYIVLEVLPAPLAPPTAPKMNADKNIPVANAPNRFTISPF